MALARLAMKNMSEKVASTCVYRSVGDRMMSKMQKQRNSEILKSFSSTAGDSKKSSDGREVTVSEGDNKSNLFSRRRRGRSLWRTNDRDSPALHDLFHSGLGTALMQASENINKLFRNLAPSRLMGRVKEDDECYKLRYEMPGIAKEDVKITVEDGLLRIKGEHKEDAEEESDDEYWSSSSYGYYDASLMLPDDAKVDEIKAELKDGVLSIYIPRTERQTKDVKQVTIH